MSDFPANPVRRVLTDFSDPLWALDARYKDVHSRPEPWMRERRTARLAARHRHD